MDSTPIRLCALEDIGESGKEVAVPNDGGVRHVMLFRRERSLYAYHNICPHQCRALNWAPDQFLISKKGELVCAHHGACFDLPTGVCTRGPCMGLSLKAVTISLRENEVWLESLEPPGEE